MTNRGPVRTDQEGRRGTDSRDGLLLLSGAAVWWGGLLTWNWYLHLQRGRHLPMLYDQKHCTRHTTPQHTTTTLPHEPAAVPSERGGAGLPTSLSVAGVMRVVT